MNGNNGTPGRRIPPGYRPPRRTGVSDSEYIAAANRAARRAQQESENGPLPHAPRRRRTTPVDFAAMYGMEPERQDDFDLPLDDGDIMGESEFEATRRDRTPPPPSGYRAPSRRPSQEGERPDPFDDEEPRPSGKAGDLDDSFLDEPDTFPRLREKAEERDLFDDLPGDSRESFDKPRFAGRSEREPSQDFGPPAGGVRKRPSGPREQTRGQEPRMRRKEKAPRASRFSRKTKVIITLILLFIAANLLWIGIWLFNNYTVIGGQLYGLDTTELDLKGQGITSVTGITRLSGLRRLDLSGNDITVRQYNRLANKLPECEIIWDVPVGGGVTVGNTVSDADLSSSSGVKISALSKSIPYLTALRRLDVSGCGLDGEKLYELERTYSDIDLVWDVDILGQKVSTDTEIVTVGKASVKELEEIGGKIKYFDKLQCLDLSGSGLSDSEMFDFAMSHPESKAAWEIQVFGQTCYSNAAELHLESTAENPINDISCLRYFYKLQLLSITKGEITDLSPLKSLPKLRILSLTYCKITDVTDLGTLTDLVYLELNNNHITDISPLSGLSNLEELHLNSNSITDISPLSGLGKLKVLNIQKNNITSVGSFGDLPSLEIMSLQYNYLSEPGDITALYSIPSLKELDLSYNDFRRSVREEIAEEFKRANPDCNLYIWIRRKD